MKELIAFTEDVKRTWKDHTGDSANTELLHIVLGLSGEILEELTAAIMNKNQVNKKEEVGDYAYYLIMLMDYYGITGSLGKERFLPIEHPEALKKPYRAIQYTTGMILDIIKKLEIYKRDNAEHRNYLILAIHLNIQALEHFSKDNGFTVVEAIEAVINKLKVRYPDKFADQGAVGRNHELEMKELQK